jgi:putative transposase
MKVAEGAWINYAGQRWQLDRRQGNTMEWRCRATMVHKTFTDAELQREIAAGRVKFYSGIGRAPREGKSSRVHGKRRASELDHEEARRKLIYVLALRDAGMPGEDKAPDDWKRIIDEVFDDQGCTWKRLRSRTTENVAKPCLKSVRRWVADAGEPPRLEKLIPQHRNKGNYEDKIDSELRQFIGDKVDEHYLTRPPITLEDLKVRIAGAMTDFNKSREANGRKMLTAPSTKAIQTSINAVPKDVVLRMRYGDMAAFLRYGSAEAQPDPEAPLDRVELDATRMDIFVVDPDTGLPIGRPTLVVAIDRCTRMVLGWFVTFEAPSIGALMQTLRNAILPKDYLDQVIEERGWVINNRPETFGVPRVLVLDRGRENIAESVARFAVRAGVNRVEIMAGKKPWLKGAVERVIKTISEKLLHPAKGTTFHNVLERMDYDSEKDAVCTPDDLDYGLHKFFIDVYPFSEHRGIGNRQPIKLWRELTDGEFPVDSIGSIEEVNHLFGRTDQAVPGRHGISAHNMQYYSHDLLHLRSHSPEFNEALKKRGGQVEFHTDPACLDVIHVQLPHIDGPDGVIHVSVAPKWRDYAAGLSLWHHRRIREYTKAESRSDADALLRSKLELIEIMRGSAVGKRGSLRARGWQARMDGLYRLARAGTDARTTVPGSEAHKATADKAKPPRAVNDVEKPGAPKLQVVTDHALADEAGKAASKPEATLPEAMSGETENHCPPDPSRPRKKGWKR